MLKSVHSLLAVPARIQVNLDNHPKFKEALSYSDNRIEVVLGFKKDGEEIDDCYKPHSNIPTDLEEDESKTHPERNQKIRDW